MSFLSEQIFFMLGGDVFGAVPGVAGAFIMVESRIEEASVQETEAGSHPYCCPVRGLVSCQIL